MKVDMLVSTMNKKNIGFLNEMGIYSNAVVINQITEKNNICPSTSVTGDNLKFISVNDKGLTKSRNLALENSTNDICVLCDDDLFYYKDYEEKILEAYIENSEADIIVFQVKKSNDSFYKRYGEKKKYLNFFTSMKVSSVEITFKRNSIIDSGIKFNEHFGAGSRFTSGEELIFLAQCLKSGLKILYVPICIGKLMDSESTWFNGFDKEYFISKGACFYASNPKLFLFLIIQFLIRKNSLYKNNINFFSALKFMLKGKEIYSKLV
jgi:glycosyltransferase involved in cell wall biosynthesis